MTAKAVFGIDSLTPCAPAILETVRSTAFLGATPAFWGRYFHRPGQVASDGKIASHYDGAKENAILSAEGIRLAIIARQTGHVGGSEPAGGTDARFNVDAIFAELPPDHLAPDCSSPLVFLDVEEHPHLSVAYWRGWAQALVARSREQSAGRVTLRPAIYGEPLEPRTWVSLRAAVAAGAECFGVWVARYGSSAFALRGWSERQATPLGGAPAPLLAWQYWASADDAPPPLNFDVSVMNPPFAQATLTEGLPLPPP